MSEAMRIISALSGAGWLAYLLSSLCIRFGRDRGWAVPAALRTIRAELKPFALPFLLVGQAPDLIGDPDFWDYLFFAIALYCWWMYRSDEDDDDRWKRRKQRLADKVAEVGGRLTIVPAGA